jgi:lactaldehyde dehydrogenase / glycolaldehyde dehydrogenase
VAKDCGCALSLLWRARNLAIAMQACKELKFGETYINREHGESRQGFHAGWRRSGIGGADGMHGLEEYLQTHMAYVQYDAALQ